MVQRILMRKLLTAIISCMTPISASGYTVQNNNTLININDHAIYACSITL
jgi:hypothetical protein